MMDRIYLVFEILAVLVCVYGLYGQKFQWNIYTILYVGIEVMVYQASNEYVYAKYLEPAVYVLLFIYLFMQFGRDIRTNTINYILCILITAVLQLICYLPVTIWNSLLFDYRNIIVNILLLLCILILYKYKILYKFACYMNQKGRMILGVLFILLLFCILFIYNMKINSQLNDLDCVILVSSIVMLFIIIILLQKERMINQQMKMEKSMNQLYGKALEELIERVKINQHNYKNQLVAIQGMVFTAGNLEELKQEQNDYYFNLQKEEKYSSLISGNNDPVVAGFLYSKLCNIEDDVIAINCILHIQKQTNSIFLSDLIQILGVLIDNAIEETSKEKYKSKGIQIEIQEGKNLFIEVRNICRKITMNEISDFFIKGSSTKGQDRGLGLFSVKELVKKWNGEIAPANKEINGENWFVIAITFPMK